MFTITMETGFTGYHGTVEFYPDGDVSSPITGGSYSEPSFADYSFAAADSGNTTLSPGLYRFALLDQDSGDPFFRGWVVIPASGSGSLRGYSSDVIALLKAANPSLVANLDRTISSRATSSDVSSVLAVAPGVAAAATVPNQIGAKTNCTLSVHLPSLGTITGFQKIWWTLKKSKSDLDSAALIQITEDGLTLVNGVPATDASLASITILDDPVGTPELYVDASIMGQIAAVKDRVRPYFWGCKIVKANGDVDEPIDGQMVLVDAVTKSIS